MSTEERAFWTEVFLHFMRKAGGSVELAAKHAHAALEARRTAEGTTHEVELS